MADWAGRIDSKGEEEELMESIESWQDVVANKRLILLAGKVGERLNCLKELTSSIKKGGKLNLNEEIDDDIFRNKNACSVFGKYLIFFYF